MKISDHEALLEPNWPGAFVMDHEETENVLRVMQARSPFRYYGEDMQYFAYQLEQAFCTRLGCEYALAVNSGTGALSVAMQALGIGPGDEVLIPGFLYVACIGAIVRAGAIPRLVEIDDTFCMSPEDLRQKITPQTKAVMLIHMAGTTGRLDELLTIAREHNIFVIEDVAQAPGGTYNGKPLGSFGDIATFSFQLNKNMTAGEGGLVACNNYIIAQRAYAAHDHGYPRDKNGKVYRYIETNDQIATYWGEGRRMNELSAAMLVAQEKKLDMLVASMREANQYLYAGLAGIAGAKPRHLTAPDGDSGNTVILTFTSPEICEIMVTETRKLGIRDRYFGGGNNRLNQWAVHLYYGNQNLVDKRPYNHTGRPWTDPLNAFAVNYDYGRGALPHSDDLFDRSSTLLVSPKMPRELCDHIIDTFRKVASENGL